jgi:diacylglycerol O-acyltransferase / wax synthase
MANVGVSNVPGPQVPLYMNGARAQRFFGVAPIFHGSALIFGVFSYWGRIEVTFVSCRSTVPDPAFLAECLQVSHDELAGRLTRSAAACDAPTPAPSPTRPSLPATASRAPTREVSADHPC